MTGGEPEDHDPLSVGSYSQLLLSDDVDDFDAVDCFKFTSSSSDDTPKMLCFGNDYNREECGLFFEEITAKIAQKTAGVITCSDSSSASSTTTNTTSALSKSTVSGSLTKSSKKKNVTGTGVIDNNGESGRESGIGYGAPVGKQRNGKRTKPADDSTPTTSRHAKAKKEKLGERVTALQQLVSPFGKTDTASVLHEAMGYVKFLQDQVQVLCSPYVQRLSSHPAHALEKGGESRGGESPTDLRSKGLCLVPVELTAHVAETNGADFWSPAMVLKKLSSNQ